MSIDWTWKQFSELSGVEVYEILSLRQKVFVVEQQSIYQDADQFDIQSWHLLGRNPERQIVGYARICFPGVRYKEPSIGRVLTAPSSRGLGAGREVVRLSIEKCEQEYPNLGIRIAAQAYLIKFYAGFGFEAIGDPYEEDGIDHVDMVRDSNAV
ncbi:MAG: GNAT family N-acetyltransferase [Leptolyngbyaceae cyanobacterium MO_188.B28]|nr:GNAT family N-acetyltransferase [Leptolyngbyaceae cyanobacterium MO_188.B28]